MKPFQVFLIVGWAFMFGAGMSNIQENTILFEEGMVASSPEMCNFETTASGE